jgi:alpha-1,3-fucosyltransferase
LAPPHSFINAANFKNMKALANHMILLDMNDTLYNEYFWWKPYFQVRDSQKDRNQAMCNLCARLHDEKLPRKIYSNLTDWWENKSTCIYSPTIS